MKHQIALLAAMAATLATPAFADKITFEAVPSQNSQLTAAVNGYMFSGPTQLYGGTQVNDIVNSLDGYRSSFSAANHEAGFPFGSAIEMMRADGGDFSFSGLWARHLYDKNNGPELRVMGFLDGVQVATAAINITKGNWTEVSTNTFGRVDKLVLDTFWLGNKFGTYFAIDDIVVNAPTTAVPEPETYALMLLGLAGVAALARRRRVNP
jgi:hypothetical protein